MSSQQDSSVCGSNNSSNIEASMLSNRWASPTEEKSITNEIHLDRSDKFLIKINGNIFGYSDDKEQVRFALEKIALEQTKELSETSKIRVFREDFGEKIILSTQAIGKWVNGIVSEVYTIEAVPIFRVNNLYRDTRDE